MDIIFPENDRTSPKEIDKFYENKFKIKNTMSAIPRKLQDNDLIFSSALERSGTIMGIYLNNNSSMQRKCIPVNGLTINLDAFDLHNSINMICNTSSLTTSAMYHGFVNTYIDEDAVLRRMPLLRKYNDTVVPTLSLATLLSIDDSIASLETSGLTILNHDIRTDEKSNVLLHFYENDWYKKVSVLDLLNNRVPKEMIMGKIVLLASSSVALHDQIIVTGGKKVIGVKVHVTMIDNILNDEYLIQPEFYKLMNIIFSLVISFILFTLLYKKYHAVVASVFLLSLIGVFGTIYFSMNYGVYTSVAYFLAPFLVSFFVIVLIYVIIDTYDKYLFKEALTKQHIADLDFKVTEATAALVQSHKHLQDNINYASLIQNALLPNEEILEKYTEDSFVFWRPKDIVGGDIYFVSELSSKKEILVMIIDGAGHGVSGAFVTMLVKAIEAQVIGEIESKKMPPSPALILEFFNKSMKIMLKQEGTSKSNAGFDGGILYYNQETNTCKYAGAKTPLYIVENGEVEIIKSDRKNVGYVRTKMDQKYTEYDIEIKKETKLYISTDGVFDQESPDNKRFGKNNFQTIIQGNSLKSFQQQRDVIISELEQYQGNCEQSDDITVIGINFKGK